MCELQVLVATMCNNSIPELYRKMNLNSDAIFINQSNEFCYENFEINQNNIECFTFKERGLSRSRNNALMRSWGNIICFADDDMKYSDTYVNDIICEFEKHPDADAILFYVEAVNGTRKTQKIDQFSRVSRREARLFTSVNIAVKRESLLYNNVFFNIMFGSGMEYSCGEDTIFLQDILKKRMKVYKSPIKIADVDMSESSWFKGFNEKYFRDRGAILAASFPYIGYCLLYIQALKNSKKRLGSYKYFWRAFRWYKAGYKDYKTKLHN